MPSASRWPSRPRCPPPRAPVGTPRLRRAQHRHHLRAAHGQSAAVPGTGKPAPRHLGLADHRPRRAGRHRRVRGPAERPARPVLPPVRHHHGQIVPGDGVPLRLVPRPPGPPGLDITATARPAADRRRHRRRHPHGDRPVAPLADHHHRELAVRRYLLRLDAASGAERYVPITVRSASTAGAVVILNENDHLAGLQPLGWLQSLARARKARPGDRGYAVSFNRPYDGDGAVQSFLAFDQAAIAWPRKQTFRSPTRPTSTSTGTRRY